MGKKTVRKRKGYSSAAGSIAASKSEKSAGERSEFELREEVERRLECVYECFCWEFRKRIQERQTASDPGNVQLLQVSDLDDRMKREIHAKVEALVLACGVKSVFNTLEAHAFRFVRKLFAGVKEQIGVSLRLALLEDAFNLLFNVTSITESFLCASGQSSSVLPHTSKREFLRLLTEDEELRPFSPPFPLDFFQFPSNFDRNTAERAKSDSEIRPSTMTIEELVLFITEQDVPQLQSAADSEVSAFRSRLERAKSSQSRLLKPLITDAWLSRLLSRTNSSSLV